MLSYSNDGMQNPYMGFDYQVNNLHQLSMDGLYEDDDEVNEKINTALIEEKTGTTGVVIDKGYIYTDRTIIIRYKRQY